MIRGWANLENRILVHEYIIQRWIALYNFPIGYYEKGSRVWDEEKVDQWMRVNQKLFTEYKATSKCYRFNHA